MTSFPYIAHDVQRHGPRSADVVGNHLGVHCLTGDGAGSILKRVRVSSSRGVDGGICDEPAGVTSVGAAGVNSERSAGVTTAGGAYRGVSSGLP